MALQDDRLEKSIFVSAIRSFAADGSIHSCKRALFLPCDGLVGNIAKHPEWQVSLLNADNLTALRMSDGLCTKKFDANVYTIGLDYARLRVGSRVRIGTTMLVITQLGKHCYKECPLLRRGGACPLQTRCAFARVAAGGEVAVGDAMTVEEDIDAKPV